MKKNLYVISGCNGAGKTTASYTVLPEMLHCREFVNADEIARGLSPFNPSSVSIDAGRLMLSRISELLADGVDFAFETTLATRTYRNYIKKARSLGYKITLLYFWLSTPELAVHRVQERVAAGGHSVSENTIRRRYYKGIENLFDIYLPLCDYWMMVDNSACETNLIAEGEGEIKNVFDTLLYNEILSYERQ